MSEVQIKERLGVEALAAVIMNFESDGIEEYRSLLASLERGEYQSKPKNIGVRYEALRVSTRETIY